MFLCQITAVFFRFNWLQMNLKDSGPELEHISNSYRFTKPELTWRHAYSTGQKQWSTTAVRGALMHSESWVYSFVVRVKMDSGAVKKQHTAGHYIITGPTDGQGCRVYTASSLGSEFFPLLCSQTNTFMQVQMPWRPLCLFYIIGVQWLQTPVTAENGGADAKCLAGYLQVMLTGGLYVLSLFLCVLQREFLNMWSNRMSSLCWHSSIYSCKKTTTTTLYIYNALPIIKVIINHYPD